MDDNKATFNGWAIIELFGHQREAGLVKTEYFGQQAMFRVNVPGLPEETRVTEVEEYFGGRRYETGTKVVKAATQSREKWFGLGAVYAMRPATFDEVREELDSAYREEKPVRDAVAIEDEGIPF